MIRCPDVDRKCWILRLSVQYNCWTWMFLFFVLTRCSGYIFAFVIFLFPATFPCFLVLFSSIMTFVETLVLCVCIFKLSGFLVTFHVHSFTFTSAGLHLSVWCLYYFVLLLFSSRFFFTFISTFSRQISCFSFTIMDLFGK